MNEREEISRGLATGISFAKMARLLRRPTSAVSREVAESGGREAYRAQTAQRRAVRRAARRRLGHRKLLGSESLRRFVHERLLCSWSPDQMAQELRIRYPHDTSMRVSHEAIYAYVYVLPRGELRRRLIAGLRQERKYRRRHRTGAAPETRGKIADMLSITERPREVADRAIPGHWEGDIILGRYKRSALGTLVERTTRLTLLVPLAAKDAGTVRRAYARKMHALPRELTKTLTYDQGKEMSEHTRFTMDTGIQVYFAHPGAPWERGTNENTNGLVRQFFPKGTDFSKISRRQIRHAQDLLNGRPRRSLGYRKPVEVFNERVALET